MPLSIPAPRKLMHTRAIECKGYEREDGLWDIEAQLVDTKSYVHSRRHGGRERKVGEPVHHMWLRLTIDLDMHIHDAEAVTDSDFSRRFEPSPVATQPRAARKRITVTRFERSTAIAVASAVGLMPGLQAISSSAVKRAGVTPVSANARENPCMFASSARWIR